MKVGLHYLALAGDDFYSVLRCTRCDHRIVIHHPAVGPWIQFWYSIFQFASRFVQMIGGYLHTGKPGDCLARRWYLICLIDICDSGKYVLRSIRIQYVSALRSKKRSTNPMLQTLSPKPNYYSVTSRLLSVRIFQARRRIGRFVLTVINRCKAATSRCVHCPDYWHAAWCRLELQCARHKLLLTTSWHCPCSHDEFNHR